MNNEDTLEIAKFNKLGEQWWDPEGPFKTLHKINPLRLNYVKQYVELQDKKLIDVGCGGGIFSEALAQAGAQVHGIDLSPLAIKTAQAHAASQGLSINYQDLSAQALAQTAPESFEVVTCMELLEHVSDPVELIKSCAALTKPGGHLFFSTLNRHPKAYLFAILGAEYLLKLIKPGTHDYGKFIRPSELEAWATEAGLELKHLSGFSYNPWTEAARLSSDLRVNYLAHFRKKDV